MAAPDCTLAVGPVNFTVAPTVKAAPAAITNAQAEPRSSAFALSRL